MMKFKLLLITLSFTTILIAQNSNYIQNKNSDSTFNLYLFALVVKDVESSANWYKEKLNFEIVRKMNFPEYDSLKIIFMKRGEVEIELIQKKSSFAIKKYVPDYDGFAKSPLRGIAKIAFWIQDVNDLAAKLKTMEVKFLVEPYNDKDFGERSFIIEDIDGNVLQFNQRI